MVEICITVLIGLPAAGKTTFCKNFLSKCDLFNLIHICYDDYIKYNPNEDNDYKIQRKNMISKIRNCIEFIQKNQKIPSEFKKCSKYFDDIQKYIILIDDNNYYRGMRYEFLQLSRKLHTSIGQIYFNCSLEFAIEQNSLRENKSIPFQIIENMNKRLEKPVVTENNWERSTFTIASGVEIDYLEIYNFLRNCLQKIECETVVEQKTSICQSEIHKIDLELRKAIGKHLKSLNSNENISCVAQKLNEKRKSIIKDLKLGTLQLRINDDTSEIINLLRK